MAITQLSAFLENRPGTLYGAVSAISDAGINIRALSVADTRDFGILRLIVSDVEKTKEVLSDGVVITETKVIAARMSDEAGSLKKILKIIQDTGVNIEYVYAFTQDPPTWSSESMTSRKRKPSLPEAGSIRSRTVTWKGCCNTAGLHNIYI